MACPFVSTELYIQKGEAVMLSRSYVEWRVGNRNLMHLPVKRYLALLVTYLKPQWGRTIVMGALLLVNVGLQLLNPQIVRFFIDTIIVKGPSTTLAFYALLLMLVTLVDDGEIG